MRYTVTVCPSCQEYEVRSYRMQCPGCKTVFSLDDERPDEETRAASPEWWLRNRHCYPVPGLRITVVPERRPGSDGMQIQ